MASVGKSFRYAGGEVGQVRKDWDSCEVRVCLAFPEIYEMGMSHLGLSILYHIINAEEGMLAERAFAPWMDMEEALRARGQRLFSLESHRPLSDFDIIGVSLASEFTYTNALTIIDLAGLPMRAAERGEGHPLVIAGGPCAFNPMPVAAFFDAIVIGDGEDVILEIAEAVRESGPGTRDRGPGRANREALLRRLQTIQGVYVPTLFPGSRSQVPDSAPGSWSQVPGPGIGMARVPDLDAAAFPSRPIAAYAATHERAAVEAARGCTRGCRFCQAGYTYRPLRQRSCESAASLACDAILSSGREEFSFLSLSIGDWRPLGAALACVHSGVGSMPVNATLPSLRVESLTQPVIDALGSARAGSFTLAPEAATERMRRFINKGNTDDDLYASVEKVFASGWHAIKLYFMLGLPGETAAEVEGIVEISNRCLDIGRRYHKRPDVTVSTSTFVPKAHTPLQWERQIGIDETLTLQRELKRRLRRPGLAYRWHGAEMSFLEGVLARGGSELAPAIEHAWRAGARFDGWDECFNLARWREAFAASGIDAESYLAARPSDATLPWDRLGAGPSRAFLWRERERAYELAATEDCSAGSCAGCGICDSKTGLINRVANIPPLCKGRLGGVDQDLPPLSPPRLPAGGQAYKGGGNANHVFRYRVRFRKEGRAAFLGHLESLDALRRCFRAAGLPLVYSEGYHPRARIAAGPALPVGVSSAAEYADIELAEEVSSASIVEATAGRLPDGMAVMDAEPIPAGAPSIEECSGRIRYEIGTAGFGEELPRAIAMCARSAPIPLTRERKGKRVEVDLRDYIAELAQDERGVLGISVNCRQPALKISEILQCLFGISEQDARSLRISKIGVEWK
ncbi:MAG: TIGR03960 family B12-binding radical SAM protein [bacterium]